MAAALVKVTAVAQIQSLARELSHAGGAAIKLKKKKKKKKKGEKEFPSWHSENESN